MNKIFCLFAIALCIDMICFSIAKGQDYERIDSLHQTLISGIPVDRTGKTLLKISGEFEMYNADSALKYSKRAYAVAEQYDDIQGKVNALLQNGRSYLQLNDFSHAMESLESAIKLSQKSGMTNEEAIANGVIGIIYADLGDFDNSAKFNFRSLELFEQVGNKKEVGITLGNIAADMHSQKNYKKALDYMNEALNIAKEINDKPGIAFQFNNIAGVYFASYKDYEKAMGYYKKAYRVNLELGDKMQMGINLLNLGYCFFRLQKNDSALRYFENARKIFEESGNQIRIANGEIALGKYYFDIHDLNKSIEYSMHALNIGVSFNSKEIIAEATDILHDIYVAKKDTANAYKYSLMNFRIRDTLQMMQSQKTLIKLEYQYNYEKQDKARKLKQQRSNFIMGFLILGLLSGIIIIFLTYSRQRIKIKNAVLEKQKITADLDFKTKELTINLMALMKKNEILAEVSKKLLVIEKKVPRDELPGAIVKLNKELRKTSDEKIWKEFALRFNQINKDFYDKLFTRFPDLTQNELKLCAYLRLNMTSKEIAEITGQQIHSLENARYRLRKKLGITGSDSNLVAFLSQI